MALEITTINLWETNWMMKGAKGVNCYLVQTGEGYVLIDTGMHARRADLVAALESMGCQPGDLDLIVITHADLDHTGNCAYLRKLYGARVAIHPAEVEAVRSGNMTLNRTRDPGVLGGLMLSVVSLFSMGDRFKPDIEIEEGYDLSGFGLDAKVIELPGHSRGSIGILTAEGDLFCGDLMGNIDGPAAFSLVDDAEAMQASIERVRKLGVNVIYPGHGEPFLMGELGKEYEWQVAK